MNRRPFLKWPGGKFRLMDRIRGELRDGRRLIEPFTGSAAVFLNTSYPSYLLADTNPDLIGLYRQIADEGQAFIAYCRRLFRVENNNAEKYYRYREEFNRCSNPRRKSALFLYLNRHCYNGLVRYNRSGQFNTPFGRHVSPYFPERELRQFLEIADRADFINAGFEACLGKARQGDVVYCDPPYTPLTSTSCFTDYHSGGFGWSDQIRLAEMSEQLAGRGIQVVISNHDTVEIRELYTRAGARLAPFKVQRMIGAATASRKRVGELLAVFG